jgi:CHAT domain-containing protein/Tfp pilus assembly protein PilF
MFVLPSQRPQLSYWKLYLARYSLLLFLTFLVLVGISAAQSEKATPTLELGKPIECELAGGQSHSYRIVLTSGQYLHVIVDQRGIDVVVTLFDPAGKQVIEVDSPNGTQGPEPVFAIAESSGTYRLDVRSFEKDVTAGRYEARIEELRTAVEQDKSRVAGERAFMQAELLRAQGTGASLQGAINKYEEALPPFQAIGNRSRVASILHTIGFIHYTLGHKQKALDSYEKALLIFRAAEDPDDEAATLHDIGIVYYSANEQQKALDYFTQALRLVRVVGNHSGEAITLHHIGLVYYALGEYQKAIDYYQQALTLRRSIKDSKGEAEMLNSIGVVHLILGEIDLALEYYTQALSLRRATKDIKGEAETLSDIGLVYHTKGEWQRAFDYYIQALPLRRATGDRDGEAATLNDIGGIYDDLGEKLKGIDYYEQSLDLYRAVKNHDGEAKVLNNIGGCYNDLGEYQKALSYFTQALPLYLAGNFIDRSMTLNNIGLAYYALGEPQKALDYYAQALALTRDDEDRGHVARTFTNIGKAYYSLGEYQKALDYFTQALPVSHSVGDRDAEAKELDNLMQAYRALNNCRLAIFYGKQAVNVYQQLRSNVKGLDKSVQKTYLRTVERTYRDLAELLIIQGRFAEAQQVLGAFKDQQYFDFDQAQIKTPIPLTRTLRETEFENRYEKISDTLGAIGEQVFELKRKFNIHQPTEEEARQLKHFEAQLKSASDAFSALAKQVEDAFSKPIDEKDRVVEIPSIIEMESVLQQLDQATGQRIVVVYTLVGQEQFHALVVTADGITSVTKPIKSDELNNKARQLWALLQSADYDPTGLSNELYKAIFKPVEDILPKNTHTIIWSLDGNLRYLPMAALYDGKHYLVERFNHVVFTRADRERLTRPVSHAWTGYGFSASEAHKVESYGSIIEFGRLEFGNDEMQIFRTKSFPTGLINGDVFAEAQFNRASLLAALKQRRPLVHISSHFRFQPGDEAGSFLLLGDGNIMTLAEMKDWTSLFQGVELLTLSACDTAAQRPDATGREIDAFAELAQRLGAASVLASLWSVRDRSTALLMKGFYRNREGGKQTKAEALRNAQLDLLYGNIQKAPAYANQGNEAVRHAGSPEEAIVIEKKYLIPFKIDQNKPFAHPYYWSPFVLFGNWR